MLAFSALPVMAAEGPDAEQTASTQPVTAAAAPLPAAPPRYSVEILSALKHLSALLRKGPLVDQKGLDSLALEISGLDGRITELLGPAIILELEKEEGELLYRAQLAAARAELQGMRTFLLAYYSDTGGKYPGTPAELVPAYIPAVPELELPWHAKTGGLALIGGTAAEPAEAVTDTGGWLYFNEPKSDSFGMLLLNCSHRDGKGVELYKY